LGQNRRFVWLKVVQRVVLLPFPPSVISTAPGRPTPATDRERDNQITRKSIDGELRVHTLWLTRQLSRSPSRCRTPNARGKPNLYHMHPPSLTPPPRQERSSPIPSRYQPQPQPQHPVDPHYHRTPNRSCCLALETLASRPSSKYVLTPLPLCFAKP